jgi:hypothetical protein
LLAQQTTKGQHSNESTKSETRYSFHANLFC